MEYSCASPQMQLDGTTASKNLLPNVKNSSVSYGLSSGCELQVLHTHKACMEAETQSNSRGWELQGWTRSTLKVNRKSKVLTNI